MLPCAVKCKHSDDNPCSALTCCAEVRAIALFEALGGFDRLYLAERASSDQRSKQAATKYRKSATSSVGPGGTGYGMGISGLHPFATNKHHRAHHKGKAPAGSSSSRTALSADHWDEVLLRALSTITMLLPSPYSDSAQVYDMLPHSSVGSLLSLSQLPELLATLLRNDSITDWTARSDLYHAMLVLLRRMADCEVTLEVCLSP